MIQFLASLSVAEQKVAASLLFFGLPLALSVGWLAGYLAIGTERD